ncbi:DUF1295-domain-containing protein [Lentinus tigrinus ALCF2SS1-7]|uniref:DUF1295-domain-containing protein n=1 Tax=Lentinus tigrinus ALCF2SS1-6 TaxID=1328759 RepID=A0A5C2SB12_9APHY|nr:DUF1295-domain-containing protein [Lentinus tigrinus ALCF2SS1-6]RPD75098.1 DUF1295-domain-containing protein [Lentinus tigrinus ALCF2SS1-7]
MAPLPWSALIYKGIPPTSQWPVKFCLYNAAAAWVLGIVTGNVSQVDRVWTFLPTIYTAYYALLPLWPTKPPLPMFPYVPETVHPEVVQRFSPRALLMFALTFTWMCRLTYNTWRRGLFNLKDEDYRWEILRQKLPAWFFQVVHLVFIAFIQNIMLFIFAVPAQIAALQQPEHLSTSDYVLAALAIIDIAAEFTADNQHYSFQTYKRTGSHEKNDWPGARIQWTPADAKRGFITRGLWAWSRHPNFFCEQSFWVIMNLFPLLAPESPRLPKLPLHSITPLWPLIPTITICSLFYSSTKFTESISAPKYPAYAAYQQRVSMFVPFLTPVWGLLLKLWGKKEQVDTLVYGQLELEEKKSQ